jgi:hypothetical protein
MPRSQHDIFSKPSSRRLEIRNRSDYPPAKLGGQTPQKVLHEITIQFFRAEVSDSLFAQSCRLKRPLLLSLSFGHTRISKYMRFDEVIVLVRPISFSCRKIIKTHPGDESSGTTKFILELNPDYPYQVVREITNNNLQICGHYPCISRQFSVK